MRHLAGDQFPVRAGMEMRAIPVRQRLVDEIG